MAMSGSDYFDPGLGSETGVPFVTVGSGSGYDYNVSNYAGIDIAINAAITAGASWILVSPASKYTASATWSFQAVRNIVIEGEFGGGIGWSGAILTPTNYISLSTSPDGITISTGNNNPATAANQTCGIKFIGIAFVGTNTNGSIHLGGGERQIQFFGCFISNLQATTGHAIIADTSLTGSGAWSSSVAYVVGNMVLVSATYYICILGNTNQTPPNATYWTALGGAPTSYNGENNAFWQTDIAGAYNAIGIGILDTGQHANDYTWDGIRTSAVNISVNAINGGNHNFRDYYDRSNPTTATIQNTTATMIFTGGELQNNAAPVVVIAGASGRVVLSSINITQVTTQTPQVSWTSTGTVIILGASTLNAGAGGTPNFAMGTNAGKLYTDAWFNPTTGTLTGSSASAKYFYAGYSPFGPFVTTGFSGAITMYGGGLATTTQTTGLSAAQTSTLAAASAYVMAGFALSFTPLGPKAIVRLMVNVSAESQTAAVSVSAQAAYGTGTAPSNGALYCGAWSAATTYVAGDFVLSGGNYYVCILGNVNNVPPNTTYWTLSTIQAAGAPQGTTFGTAQTARMVSANTPSPLTVLAVVLTGLTPGTAYWFDLQYKTATVADAASLLNGNAIVEELAQ